MAKTKISEWDSSAAGNTDINGININEGCPPSTINNAIRETMAQVKDLQSGASGDTIPVLSGGTGSATASGARTNLGLGTIATQAASAVAITGGTANGLTSVATGTLAATGTTTLSGAVTSSNSLNVTGTMLVDGASGTSGQFLTSAGSGNTPTWTTLTAFVSGMIMMWSGTVATIPSGWLLCNGTSGTPDLRNKFIIGANADDGGAAKTNVTGSYTQTGGSKDAIIPYHNHTATSSVTDSGHAHEWSYSNRLLYNAGGGNPNTLPGGAANQTTSSATTGISVSTTVNYAGSSGNTTNANLPPYYALAFIMKS
jgi:hypothetical protein